MIRNANSSRLKRAGRGFIAPAALPASCILYACDGISHKLTSAATDDLAKHLKTLRGLPKQDKQKQYVSRILAPRRDEYQLCSSSRSERLQYSLTECRLRPLPIPRGNRMLKHRRPCSQPHSGLRTAAGDDGAADGL